MEGRAYAPLLAEEDQELAYKDEGTSKIVIHFIFLTIANAIDIF